MGIVFENITARVKIEQELKLSEIKYRNIFCNIQDIYFETEMGGKILEISPSVKKIMGYEPEEVIGRNIEQFYVDPGYGQEGA